MSRKVKAEEYMTWDKCIRDDTKTSDCIDRETVLYLLKEKWNMFSDANDAMQESIDSIRALPSVQPERAKGEWKVTHNGKPICSCCKYISDSNDGYTVSNFCPNCGADMR